MDDTEVRIVIYKYMSTILRNGAFRFVNTKRNNFLELTTDIEEYKDSLALSIDLNYFSEIKSINDIEFIFENEILISAIFSLSKKEQNVIYYKYILELTDSEISKIYGVGEIKLWKQGKIF